MACPHKRVAWKTVTVSVHCYAWHDGVGAVGRLPGGYNEHVTEVKCLDCGGIVKKDGRDFVVDPDLCTVLAKDLGLIEDLASDAGVVGAVRELVQRAKWQGQAIRSARVILDKGMHL